MNSQRLDPTENKFRTRMEFQLAHTAALSDVDLEKVWEQLPQVGDLPSTQKTDPLDRSNSRDKGAFTAHWGASGTANGLLTADQAGQIWEVQLPIHLKAV